MTASPTTTPVRSLSDLSIEILDAHSAFIAMATKTLEQAKHVGELLIEAKAQLHEHGAWLRWLEAHCPEISPRTAQGYMRLARQWPQLLEKAAASAPNTRPVAYLGIRKALALLADEWHDTTDDNPDD